MFLGKYSSFVNMVQTQTPNFGLNPRPFHLAPSHVFLIFFPLKEEKSRPQQGTQES